MADDDFERRLSKVEAFAYADHSMLVAERATTSYVLASILDFMLAKDDAVRAQYLEGLNAHLTEHVNSYKGSESMKQGLADAIDMNLQALRRRIALLPEDRKT